MANKSDYIIRKTFGPNVIKNHVYNDRAKSIKDIDVIPPPTGLGSAGTAFMDVPTETSSTATSTMTFEMDDITNESRVLVRRFAGVLFPTGFPDEDQAGTLFIANISMNVGFSDDDNIGTSGIPYLIGNSLLGRITHFETMMDTWVSSLDSEAIVVFDGLPEEENRTLAVSHNLIAHLQDSLPGETINTYQDFINIPTLTTTPRLNILNGVELTVSIGPRLQDDNRGFDSPRESMRFVSTEATSDFEFSARTNITDTVISEDIETNTNTSCPLFPAFDDDQEGCLRAGGEFASDVTVSTTPEYTEISAELDGAAFAQRTATPFSSPFVNDAGSNDGLVTTTSITTRTVTRRNVISSFEASEVGRGNLVRVHHSGSTRIGFAPTPTITFSEIERMIQLTGAGDVCITATDEFIHAEIDTSIVRLEILDITE